MKNKIFFTNFILSLFPIFMIVLVPIVINIINNKFQQEYLNIFSFFIALTNIILGLFILGMIYYVSKNDINSATKVISIIWLVILIFTFITIYFVGMSNIFIMKILLGYKTYGELCLGLYTGLVIILNKKKGCRTK